jgi:HAE1 family hydrophobic/amphiphilic exporter-1
MTHRASMQRPSARRRSLSILLLLSPLLGLWPAHADEVRTLILAEALEIAARQNRAIARAVEFRNQAEGVYLAERAAALPQLTARWVLARADDNALDTPAYDRREATVQLDQALLTWGEVQAGIRAARYGLQTADEQLRASRQDALQGAAAAFFDVLLARELHSVFAQNLAQKTRRLDEARKRQAVGLATDYDVLVAEVAEANARPEVLRSDKLIRSQRDRLRLVLGLNDPVDAAGNLAAELIDPPDYAAALAVARERRPELRDLRHRIGIAEEQVIVAAAGDKPRIDLAGSYGWKELDTNSGGRDGDLWDLGLTLSWPFFDGMRTRGRVLQAQSERDALKIDEQQLLDTIDIETREAIDRILVATELVRALDGTVAQAERLLRLAEKGFEYGVKIRLEVDDAELNLRQAQSSLALARRDYLVAEVELARAMGILGEDSFPGLPVPPLTAVRH